MEKQARSTAQNRLLASLSEADRASLQSHFEPVKLRVRQRLQSRNRRVKAIYFLESGIASVVAIAQGSHVQAEVGIVGREGMVGLPAILGGERANSEIFIQVEGHGQCIPTEDLLKVMNDRPRILAVFLRYLHVFLVQVSFTALANAHGKIEERLARWLLMSQDRVGEGELRLTHEFLALMLGVRRAGVTVALKQFERKGLIAAARGAISIRDRNGLEETAHGLYGMPEAEYEKLFPASS